MDEVTVTIAAPPERIYDLVSDLRRMGEWSPENRGGRWLGGARGAAVGAKFRGKNQHGPMRWGTTSTVVAADRPTHFAFEVRESGMRWGYRLKAEGDGTEVTEYRERYKPYPKLIKVFVASGVIGRGREALMVDGMRATLEMVKAEAEATS